MTQSGLKELRDLREVQLLSRVLMEISHNKLPKAVDLIAMRVREVLLAKGAGAPGTKRMGGLAHGVRGRVVDGAPGQCAGHVTDCIAAGAGTRALLPQANLKLADTVPCLLKWLQRCPTSLGKALRRAGRPLRPAPAHRGPRDVFPLPFLPGDYVSDVAKGRLAKPLRTLVNLWLGFMNLAYAGPGGLVAFHQPSAAQRRTWDTLSKQAHDLLS